MNALEARRRLLVAQKKADEWDYIFTADAEGFCPKDFVPVNPGDHILIEWDVSKYTQSPRSGYQTAFAVNNTSQYYATVSDTGLSGNYPIVANSSYNVSVFTSGRYEFVAGNSVAYIAIGCWTKSVMNRDYNLYGDYVRIKIN